MKDGKFETRAEIWRHLLEGGRVKVENIRGYYFLKDGEVYHSNGYRGTSDFKRLENWSIYEEPKPKKKVTLYRYTYSRPRHVIEQTFWTTLEWTFYKDFNIPSGELLTTESKEVEYDDV